MIPASSRVSMPFAQEQALHRPRSSTALLNVVTQANFIRDTLVAERAKELCVEGHRRWDLIRLGRYKQIETGVGFNIQPYQYLLPLAANRAGCQ